MRSQTAGGIRVSNATTPPGLFILQALVALLEYFHVHYARRTDGHQAVHANMSRGKEELGV